MTTTPYRDAAAAYYAAGWRGVLPVPGKWPPPRGFTGAAGAWPSFADVVAWAEDTEGELNVALRLPEGVIGIDVDAYGDKPGGNTLAAALGRFGPLPGTWSTSSREGLSGIRLYAVPHGLAWPGEVGPGVEVIQYRHRYAMVWPSVHPSGEVYLWHTDNGLDLDVRVDRMSRTEIPRPDELPALPAAWVEGLTRGRAEVDVVKADLGDADAVAWLAQHGGGERCPAVARALGAALLEVAAVGSRHEAMTRGTARLAHLAADGHRGVLVALGELGAAFEHALGAEAGARAGEWNRAVTGAVRIAAARAVEPLDPCTLVLDPADPFGRGRPVEEADANLAEAVEAFRDTARDLAAQRLGVPTGAGNLAPVVELRPVEAAQQPAPAPAAPNPAYDAAVALEVAQQRARRDARKLLDDEEAARSFREPPSLPTLAHDLARPDEPVTYAVDELLPTGGNALLTAGFKTGKTTLMGNLVRAYADGEAFLDRFAVADLAGRRVGLFNYELDARQQTRWLRDVGIEHPERVAVLNLRGYRLPILTPSVEDWVVRWLVEHDVAVWIVDPFARAAVGSVDNENDNSAVGRFLDALDVVKARAGVTELILPTHTGRAEQEQGSERARGATRLDDWADVRWILTRDDAGARYFRATGRDVEFGEAQLRFDENSRRLSLSGVGNRHTAKAVRWIPHVIEFVAANPGATKNAVRDGVLAAAPADAPDRGKEHVEHAVDLAVRDDYLVRGSGPRGSYVHTVNPLKPLVAQEWTA